MDKFAITTPGGAAGSSSLAESSSPDSEARHFRQMAREQKRVMREETIRQVAQAEAGGAQINSINVITPEGVAARSRVQ